MLTKRLRVLVAEDHPIYRHGLIAALERGLPGLVGVGVMGCEQTLALLRVDDEFDAVLVDMKLPDGNGLQLLAQVRQSWPSMPCILISGSDDPALSGLAQKLGCIAFLHKSLSSQEMIFRLQRALSGERVFSNSARSKDLAVQLTERQLAVLQGVAKGLTNRAIAAELGITERTVKDHLGLIFGRLDAATRTEAATRAAALGLISLEAKSIAPTHLKR